MSAAAVAELEAALQGMLSLKPPGVSASKVTGITKHCLDNVQYESVLVQKLFTHFKKTPATHKLGVLYVVDSVTRKWLEHAKAQGQLPISALSPDGTFAAGVHRVTELMAMLMDDIIATAPEDQKEKIKKLIEIWEKGPTFPNAMLNSFKEKLKAPRPTNESTTPTNSPPAHLYTTYGAGQQPQASAAASAPSALNATSILAQLASIARQNAPSAQSHPAAPITAPAPAPAPAPASTFPHMFSTSAVPSANGSLQAAPAPMPSQPIMPYLPTSHPPAPPVNQPTIPYGYTQPVAAAVPPALSTLNSASNPANGNMTIQVVTALLSQGVALDQIKNVIQMMGQGGAAAQPVPQQVQQPAQNGYPATPIGGMSGSAPWEPPRPNDSRERMGYHNGTRSPNRLRGRSRSRSPPRWDVRDSPRSRRNERGFDYGRHESPDRDGARGRMPDYRQRSPAGRHGQSPLGRESSQEQKWIDYDSSIPEGHIKVKSRTLFVGGVTCSDAELNDIFSRYGQVQSCIVNKDKRHAFVKMFYRKDAEKAKAAMEEARNGDLQLRTRWGVGFGPRDCSDYQVGISIIPISKLTEADRKWMLTAQYGGSGGRPIVSGMCVEEPDIEIGAGVSSKAISRRMQTDKGGNHGPKSSRRDDDFGHPSGPPSGGGSGGASGGRWRNREKHRGSHDNHHHNKRGGGDDRDRDHGGDDPIVMGLPAGITMGPHGPIYPPNFSFGP